MLVANFLVVCSSASCTFHVVDRSCRLCGCCTNVRLRRTIFSFVSMLKQNYDCHAAVMLTCTNPALLTQTFKTDLNRLRHDQVKLFCCQKSKKYMARDPTTSSLCDRTRADRTAIANVRYSLLKHSKEGMIRHARCSFFCTHGKEVRHFVYYLFLCCKRVSEWCACEHVSPHSCGMLSNIVRVPCR